MIESPRWDSNPRPTVCETAALAAELRGIEISAKTSPPISGGGSSSAAAYQSECRPERVRMAVGVQAKRPIESAAERKGASVGPEGRTERQEKTRIAVVGLEPTAVRLMRPPLFL